jgi:hypothetical protein
VTEFGASTFAPNFNAVATPVPNEPAVVAPTTTLAADIPAVAGCAITKLKPPSAVPVKPPVAGTIPDPPAEPVTKPPIAFKPCSIELPIDPKTAAAEETIVDTADITAAVAAATALPIAANKAGKSQKKFPVGSVNFIGLFRQ